MVTETLLKQLGQMLREWFVVRVWLLVWSLAVAGQKVQVGHESTQVTANFGSNYCLIVAL